MFRRVFAKVHESIWFIPSIYSVLASCLALLTVLIDTTFSDEIRAYFPSYLRTSVDLAQTILGTISGALLTMTTITFSTIMVVLTMYSSQFSPRTLQNFLNAPSTQRVLGIFMGGFVYSILSLLFMRKQTISHEVISASVSVLLAVICLAFFVYFIHSVGTSIQVSRLIRALTNDVIQTINNEKKEKNTKVWAKEKPVFKNDFAKKTDIQSNSFGYIQYIDYERLTKWALKHEVFIDIATPVGTFVGTQSILAQVYHNEELSKEEVYSHFTLGEERSVLEDIEFGIEKIAEIALRALSPGINDPNTAIRCIHSLGEVLQRASHLPTGFSITYTEDHKPVILSARPQMSDYLYVAYSQISFYGKEDTSILLAMLESLIYLTDSKATSVELKADVRNIGEYIWNRFDHTVLETLDREKLVNKRAKLRTLTAI